MHCVLVFIYMFIYVCLQANTSNNTSFDTAEDTVLPSDETDGSAVSSAALTMHVQGAGGDDGTSDGLSLNPMLEHYFHMAQLLVKDESAKARDDGSANVASSDREEGEEVSVPSQATLGGVSIDFNLYKTFWGLQVGRKSYMDLIA